MGVSLLNFLVSANFGPRKLLPKVGGAGSLLLEMLGIWILFSLDPRIGASMQGFRFPFGHASSALLASRAFGADGSSGQILLRNFREHGVELFGVGRLLGVSGGG